MLKQVVTIKGPYAVVVQLTYADEDDAKVFDEVVRSVKAK